jgi:hypothetical protein
MENKQKAKAALGFIEHQNKNAPSKFAFELRVWEDIAEQINSTTGERHDFYCDVMDLYNKKYKEVNANNVDAIFEKNKLNQ